MNQIGKPSRLELLAASDETIENAVNCADPMALRGLVYQLTGDPELRELEIVATFMGFYEMRVPVTEAGVTLIRDKATAFLKGYRDAGAGLIDIGPRDRLPESLALAAGEPIAETELDFYLEELALDPWVRSPQWKSRPDPKQVEDFTVTIIGAGMGGLNMALQLKRAGIPYTMIEKNGDVGGTWHENRYPGARVDTPSRGYTHIMGVDFGYPNAFCPGSENKRYFDWIADSFGLRDDIVFNTEVRSLAWNDTAAMWEISVAGPGGERVLRSRAVITAVGFLNRPNLPEITGMDEFQGHSWHTSRWPAEKEWRGKRIAVIGTGATGYQMIPELALEAAHVTVFQRTPQWVFPVPSYRSPFPPQVNWLDRNFPFLTNFMRFRTLYRGPKLATVVEIDPDFHDPHASSPANKRARDTVLEFVKSKIADQKLVETMTPAHPPFSARPIMVDPEYSILDAIQRDNVTLVTAGIKRITPTGIQANDGTQHDVDIIVYATGFHATEYLFPMTITGQGGRTIEQLWADDGARAYLGSMMPGFPNLWSLYGPNTNGLLHVAGVHELTALHAIEAMQRAILDGKNRIEVTQDAYWRYNHLVDARNKRKVWSDPRAHNYYWTQHGRSAVMNPFNAAEMWHFLRRPDPGDLDIH